MARPRQRRAAHGAACRTDRACRERARRLARRSAPRGLSDAGRGRARDPVHRSPRRALDEPLHEPADRADPRVLGDGVGGRPGVVAQAVASRRSRPGARHTPAVQRGGDAVPRRVPHPDEGRAHPVDPRRGLAGAVGGRLDPVLARCHARHHRAEGSRGQAPVEPRHPAAHAAAAPRARAAAATRTGGGASADRGRHPRRPDPGDERRRHAPADAAGIPRVGDPRERSAEIEREVAERDRATPLAAVRAASDGAGA